MNENIAVNITLPKEVIEYLDVEARKTYLSRATVARQLLLQHIDEIRVITARKNNYSIRKISQMYEIAYPKVLEILHMSQVDSQDKEADQYVEETMKMLAKKK
ncbi:ribbon-helix-helix protein, CopG family [Candidatus Micrarchaeota archaeon]|nr:ribbon-helix-helix protein, CopG family [Candidatus Micrarchaeota archaeon]